MPQVLASSRRCLSILVLVLPLLIARPVQAAEVKHFDWRTLRDLIAVWLGNVAQEPPPAETLPAGLDGDPAVDDGGASMDPAGGGGGGPGGGTAGGGSGSGG